MAKRRHLLERQAGDEGREEQGVAPTPIWQSRLYQQRRAQQIASRIAQERARRVKDGSLFREKRALADHLLRLCEQAELVLRRRGGDVAADLERIDDLGFIVNSLDAEMTPGTSLERLEELRNYLEAMVLAIEVSRVAHTLHGVVRRPPTP